MVAPLGLGLFLGSPALSKGGVPPAGFALLVLDGKYLVLDGDYLMLEKP